MGEILRALIVEDSEDDALLIARALRRSGYELVFERVYTPDRMRFILAQQPWDIVISDYALPGFSGLDALRILKESQLDLPFIVVSGTIGEETAVMAMKSGAHDYVMKSNLTRLAPAVQRELQEAQIRRAHRIADEQLRKLSRATEQSPVAIMITDVDGIIEYVNPKFTHLTGYSAEEVLGKSSNILRSAETPSRQYDRLWKTILSGHEWSGKFKNRKKDGTHYWVSASISAIYDQENVITHFVAIEEDITERLQSEEERAQLLARMHRQHTTIARLVTYPALSEGRCDEAFQVIVSAAAKTLSVQRVSIWSLSQDRNELTCLESVGHTSFLLEHRKRFQIEQFPCYFAAIQAGQIIDAEDVRADTRTSELTEVWWNRRNIGATLEAPIRLHGQVVGLVCHEYVGVTRRWYPDEVTFAGQIADLVGQTLLNADLRRRRREAETLQAATQALSATLDLQQVLERILSELQKVLPYNSASVQQLCGTRLEIIGGHGFPNLEELIGVSFDLTAGDNPNREVIETRAPFILDDAPMLYKEFRCEPHRQAHIRSWLGVPLLFGDRLIGMIALDKHEASFYTPEHARLAMAFAAQAAIAIENARLFAEEEQHAAVLAQALEKQRELDLLKSQFIQNVSHELRTPLAIARGYAELLERGDLGDLKPAQRQPVAVIARRMRMLSDLVADINAILEVETHPLARESVDFVNLTQAALADFQVVAEQAGLTLYSNIIPDSLGILGDITYLRRVLDNLLGNALKFTSEGGTITVSLCQEGQEMILEVVDTGIGIPEDKLERVFERFYQVDGSMNRRYGGTGLGLALVKEIVEAHGGAVDVKSEVGKGTAFRVILPFDSRR